MSSDRTKKKTEAEQLPTGTIIAEDRALALWIARQWERDEQPSAIHCYRMTGRNNQVRGEVVFTRTFRPNDRVDVERAAILANEVLSDAQDHCDKMQARRGETVYSVVISDKARSGQELVERALRLRPKRLWLNPDDADAEDDDEDRDGKGRLLRYTDAVLERAQWSEEHGGRMTGDLLLLMFQWLQESNAQQRALFSELMVAGRENLRLGSDEKDREVQREKERAKQELWKDAMKVGRNILTGLVGERQAAQAGALPPSAPRPPSAEQTLIADFLEDAEREGKAEALFGRTDGQRVTEPGIFTLEQAAIFVRVKDGALPVEAVDALLPDSGRPEAVTQEQMSKAMGVLSQGMLMGIQTLFGLRAKARTRLAAPTTTT
jgi:hypothetical protein